MNIMYAVFVTLLNTLLIGLILAGLVLGLCAVIKWSLRYLRKGGTKKEELCADSAGKPLCDILKEQRVSRNMMQEYIAEQLGVSRQAVSKWENGSSEPSTANLLALAKLYGISVDTLLRGAG